MDRALSNYQGYIVSWKGTLLKKDGMSFEPVLDEKGKKIKLKVTDSLIKTVKNLKR
jgi:hypothetical protein